MVDHRCLAIPGTVLAIIPAHLKILSLRSADGVSAHTLLLTNVQQMLASWNMLVLKFPQMQMCLADLCRTVDTVAFMYVQLLYLRVCYSGNITTVTMILQ